MTRANLPLTTCPIRPWRHEIRFPVGSRVVCSTKGIGTVTGHNAPSIWGDYCVRVAYDADRRTYSTLDVALAAPSVAALDHGDRA